MFMKTKLLCATILALLSLQTKAATGMTKQAFVQKCLAEISAQAADTLELSCRAAKAQQQDQVNQLELDLEHIDASNAKVGTTSFNGTTYWQGVSIRLDRSLFFPKALTISCSQDTDKPDQVQLASSYGIFLRTSHWIDSEKGFYLNCQ